MKLEVSRPDLCCSSAQGGQWVVLWHSSIRVPLPDPVPRAGINERNEKSEESDKQKVHDPTHDSG